MMGCRHSPLLMAASDDPGQLTGKAIGCREVGELVGGEVGAASASSRGGTGLPTPRAAGAAGLWGSALGRASSSPPRSPWTVRAAAAAAVSASGSSGSGCQGRVQDAHVGMHLQRTPLHGPHVMVSRMAGQ